MKNIKYYAFGLFILIFIGAIAYISYGFGEKKGIKSGNRSSEIIKLNSRILKAEVINDSLEYQLANAETIRITEFKYIYSDPPATDDDITKWWEEEVFLPDESVDISDIIANDSRLAVTHYKYSDVVNDYSMTLKIIYNYKQESFEFTPLDLNFKQPKKYRFTGSALISTNGYGALLQCRIWRLNLGSGILVNKEVEGTALVSVGIEF